MIELTGKQKGYLRGLAQKMPVAMTLGKAALSEPVLAELKARLVRTELLKVRLPAVTPQEKQEMAAAMATATGAACVGTLGHTALLYRPNEQLDDEKRIHLPE